jgi:hypothetical protein
LRGFVAWPSEDGEGRGWSIVRRRESYLSFVLAEPASMRSRTKFSTTPQECFSDDEA